MNRPPSPNGFGGASLLLLATTTGYQIRSFGEAAHKLGVQLVFASDRCDQLDDPWADHAIPVRFHEEAQSLEAVLSSIGADAPGVRRVDGVLAVGDRPTILAAHVACALGLPGNPPEAARASRNKLQSRSALRSVSSSFLNFGSNQRPGYSPALAAKRACTSQ